MQRCLEFRGRPSVAAYMVRALYPGVLRKPLPFPALRARWRASRPDPARLRRFLALTHLTAEHGLPLVYPHVATFPLQMAILASPAMPLPIWKVLQIRNQLVQHCTIPASAALDAEAGLVAQRVVQKGLEVDLYVGVRTDGELAWEGITTFRYSGHQGEPDRAPPVATAPQVVPASEVGSWRTGRRGGLAFSALSGDYNGIHLSSIYARLQGLPGAIHHPHVLVSHCLARLGPPPTPSQRLDVWLKGPVYYGSEVALRARATTDGIAFFLSAGENTRPALVGRWSGANSTSGAPCHTGRAIRPGELP